MLANAGNSGTLPSQDTTAAAFAAKRKSITRKPKKIEENGFHHWIPCMISPHGDDFRDPSTKKIL